MRVVPLGIVSQWSVEEKGERYIKRRVTHDCTFPGPSGKSIKKRVQEEHLEPCQYGHSMLRILYSIYSLSIKYPNSRILIRKYGIDSAYRRIHTSIESSLTSILILDEIAYILIRLPFGSTPSPREFCVLSDSISHIKDLLLVEHAWYPKEIHGFLMTSVSGPPVTWRKEQVWPQTIPSQSHDRKIK